MAAPNRNQHWVPQFYLKYFATADTRDSGRPQIWAFPITEGDEFRTSVRNVAARRDLYGFCSPQVDQRLSELEGMLGRFWPTISNEQYPIDLGFKQGISLFIATLYMRHPAQLERQRRFVASAAKALDQGPRDEQGRTLIDRFSIRGTQYKVKPAELDIYRTMGDQEIQASWGELILSESGALARELVDRPWMVLVTEQRAFITTDYPVALFNPTRRDAPILHPDTTIYLPMSPTKLVVINDDQRPGEIVQIAPGGETVFNHIIFCSAYQHLFSSGKPIDVLKQVVPFGEWASNESKRVRDEMTASIPWKVGRNDACYCGSGLKFKRCCGR